MPRDGYRRSDFEGDGSFLSGAAPVLFRKMAPEVAAIVKNAGNLDHAIFAAAVQEKMAWLLHP